MPGFGFTAATPTTPGADAPAASACRPATASAVSRATTVANAWCWVRWWLSVWATSASGTSAPAPAIQSASIAACDAIRSLVLPDTTSVVTGSGSGAGAGAATGACSRTTWALVPPKPNDDTPARRGRPAGAQSVCSAIDLQPELVERDVRVRDSGSRDWPESGGAATPARPWRTRRHRRRPPGGRGWTSPRRAAAARRRRGPYRAPCPRARASIGSPNSVPVPCAST